MPIKMLYYCPDPNDIEDWKPVEIYDITYDSDGYPVFLFYYNGQWILKSIRYFKPI